ncbi:MAG: PAS domain S-box protein [Candidatus Bathyarchaeia archaeon]
MVESIAQSHAEVVGGSVEKPKIRVLHVDDELGLLKIAKQCLEMQGPFQVDTAGSIEEAVNKLKEKEYDAVVSDYQMPGKDGLEFLKQLRKICNNVPFIILTGKSREEVVVKALNLGVDQYLDKTSDPETGYRELAYAIRQAVDRRSTQIELSKREAKLNAILESSPEAITISDLDGNIIECNRAATDLHGGQSKKDLIGRNVFELIAKKDVKRANQNLKKTIEQGSVKIVEYTLRTKDGREFPGELSASVVKDSSGKPECFVTMTRDITERKKAEAELRRLATIVTDSNDAVTVVDMGGKIISWNKGAEDTYGYRKDEALGMDVLKIVPEDKKQETLDVIGKIKMNEAVGSFETKRLAKDGRVLDVWLTVTKLVDAEGNAVALATTERDITEKKRLEERLRSSEKFTILGQLASSVAHEIRNPLGVIKNSVYFLNVKLKEHADERVAKHLRIMEGNVNSANRIISDLLDVGRNSVGAVEPADLNRILERALASLSVPENIKVITKLEKIPEMLLDPGRIQRVFVNIIENAVEAMPEGGRLIVELSRFGDSVEISFKDSGVGIPEENMQRLFTPLFTTKTRGLGLGLTICKQIVEGHQGDVEVKSKVGNGTLFIVRLPILSEAQLVKAGLLHADVLTGGMRE